MYLRLYGAIGYRVYTMYRVAKISLNRGGFIYLTRCVPPTCDPNPLQTKHPMSTAAIALRNPRFLQAGPAYNRPACLHAPCEWRCRLAALHLQQTTATFGYDLESLCMSFTPAWKLSGLSVQKHFCANGVLV